MTSYTLYPSETDLIGDNARLETAYDRRLPEIAALPPLSPPQSSYKSLNVLRQPALLMDDEGCVIEANLAAETVFGPDIQIRDRRLVVRDAAARARLQAILTGLGDASKERGAPSEPIVVPRQEKLPILLRIWPFEDHARQPSREVLALVVLNALGPRPGPPAGLLATAFSLTPSEARLACIIARGAGPDIAAKELKISRETARNQLKSIFAKTGTHRQSELVALLLQVQ
jgi:DNA-binding CsgD family transcriptional regulator